MWYYSIDMLLTKNKYLTLKENLRCARTNQVFAEISSITILQTRIRKTHYNLQSFTQP